MIDLCTQCLLCALFKFQFNFDIRFSTEIIYFFLFFLNDFVVLFFFLYLSFSFELKREFPLKQENKLYSILLQNTRVDRHV